MQYLLVSLPSAKVIREYKALLKLCYTLKLYIILYYYEDIILQDYIICKSAAGLAITNNPDGLVIIQL